MVVQFLVFIVCSRFMTGSRFINERSIVCVFLVSDWLISRFFPRHTKNKQIFKLEKSLLFLLVSFRDRLKVNKYLNLKRVIFYKTFSQKKENLFICLM